ncbi:hypothetical protein A4A49_42122 [Nicotiana attenuata]|uniref:RING-type domain-containing protein n=1 Tax=Nicotiana attenuata TaxID=49451 RepID=A0A1J6IDX9_NICAT|nr:hypothetical protein A4A49_42122 [Nicotiana attenuata]
MPPIVDHYHWDIHSDYTILTPSQLSSGGDPDKPDFLVQFRAYRSNTTSRHLVTSKIAILRFDSIITDLNNSASPFFRYLGMPEERQVNLVDEISFFADGLAMDISNAGETMFPIVVSIDISDDAYVDDFQEEAAELIKELEKVVVNEEDYYEQCPICLDRPSTGEEITYMPCSHFCHSNCLLKWFQKNASCPLCRFQCLTIFSQI